MFKRKLRDWNYKNYSDEDLAKVVVGMRAGTITKAFAAKNYKNKQEYQDPSQAWRDVSHPTLLTPHCEK